jgi:autotransporter-associated beta strand protein
MDHNVTFDGPGSLSGNMDLLKSGKGTLILNSDNDFTGNTLVWQGSLLVNGTLSQSPVEVNGYACIGGSGNLGNGVTLRENGRIIVGDSIGWADTLRISGHLTTEGNALIYFDLSDDTSGTIKSNDYLFIEGDLTLTGTSTIDIHRLDETLQDGHYTLISYTGILSGELDDINLTGMEGYPYELVNIGNEILLKILEVREPGSIVWKGGSSNDWDLAASLNWLNGELPDWFVSGDTVLFDDTGSPNTTIDLVYTLPIGRMTVDASLDYRFQGSGSISGTGGITKSGSGKLTLVSTNDYTGVTLANEGILEIPGMTPAGQAGPLGTATADPSNLILNGATLRVNGGASSSDRGMTIGSEGAILRVANPGTHLDISGEITGEGNVTVTGFGTLTLSAANSYTGGTLIWDGQVNLGSEEANKGGFGPGTVVLKEGTINMFDNRNSDTDSCNWNIEVPSNFNAWLNLDSRCSLTGTLKGDGTLNLHTPFMRSVLNGDWSGFNGWINVNSHSVGGWLLVGNQNGFGNASIDLSDNVTLLYQSSEDAVVEIGALSGTQSSVLGAGGESTNHITWVVGTNNRPAEFQGLISDKAYSDTAASTSIIKEGDGAWTLTHANTYTGTTTVNSGALIINNLSGNGTGTGEVYVNAGATLSGSGRVVGPVSIAGLGSLFVGNQSEMATFTVNKDVTLQSGSYLGIHLNPSEKGSDRLISAGNIILDGILYITKSGTGDYTAGDSYKILESASISGNFTAILPASPGEGLEWDTSAISTTGHLMVVPEGTSSTSIILPPGELLIYPNPASDRIYVSMKNLQPQVMGERPVLNCYNQQGRLFHQQRLDGSRREEVIYVGDWPSGSYLFVVKGKQGQYLRTFIKQ